MLTKEQIIGWYQKYNDKFENDSNRMENKILNSIDNINTCDDLKRLLLDPKDGILKWKGALRTIRYYDCLDEIKWKNLWYLAKGSINDPKEIVKRIVDFSRINMGHNGKMGGISYPVASTIVYFFSKEKCPIIDWRVIHTLKGNGYNNRLRKIYLYCNEKLGTHQISLKGDGWDDYYDLCHEIIFDLKVEPMENDTPIRVLDKALWWSA